MTLTAPQTSLAELDQIARRLRSRIVEMSHQTRTAHLASSLSCVDILTAAYWTALRIDPAQPDHPDRDRFILSKGHAAMTLYSALSERGFFGPEVLADFNIDGSHLPEHPSLRCVPGVEASTGSLGHGLSLGLGMAMAAKIQKRPYRVFVTMSDGECNEGTVWEAALLAPAKGLDNVIVFVDFNKWQATDRSQEVMAIDPLAAKWEAFRWEVHEIDGHDLGALVDIMAKVPSGSGKPIAVVAHTVKGKGVSFMEDDNNWHYRIPTAEEVELARKELLPS